jgi:hypothetical protein
MSTALMLMWWPKLNALVVCSHAQNFLAELPDAADQQLLEAMMEAGAQAREAAVGVKGNNSAGGKAEGAGQVRALCRLPLLFACKQMP